MATLTTGQLLGVLGAGNSASPPTGFIAVPPDKLVLPEDDVHTRIDYQAFYNPTTNELVITGTPKPQPLGGDGMGGDPTVKDAGIFYDASRVLTGSNAGGFLDDKPVPVSQTEELAKLLTNSRDGLFPNAAITFIGEGSVGLAFSMSSYDLRTDPNSATQVAGTVTLNSWLGTWTSDGKADAGVLDVRTPNPVNGGDPGAQFNFQAGGVVLKVDTGVNAQIVGGVADIATQSLIDVFGSAIGKGVENLVGKGFSWLAEKVVDQVVDASKEVTVDTAVQAVVDRLDGPVAAASALDWKADVAPVSTIQITQGDISQAQWNVMQGKSPSGYDVGAVQYVSTGAVTVAGAGSTAERREPVTQISSYRHEESGAIVEVRVEGNIVNGVFVATPGTAYSAGMSVTGEVIVPGLDGASQPQAIPPGYAPDGSPLELPYKVEYEGIISSTVWDKDPESGYFTETETATRHDSEGNVVASTTTVRIYDANGKSLGGEIRRYDSEGKNTGSESVPSPGASKGQNEPDTSTNTSSSESSREFEQALVEAFDRSNPSTPVNGGVQVADNGGVWTDGGQQHAGQLEDPNPNSFTAYLEGAGADLSAAQQQGIANQLDGLNLGNTDELSFITLSGGSTLIQNADGDVVGEIQQGADGQTRVSATRINADGSAEPVVVYIDAQGQALTDQQLTQSQAQQSAAALGLLNSIIGLQNWDSMSDLQRTAALAGIYNAVDRITGGGALPGDLGAAAGVLGLLNALDQGDAGAIVYSGLSLVESLTATTAVNAAGQTVSSAGVVTDTLGGNFLPALGFVLAVDSGDPWAMASSGVALMTALQVIPVWGQILAVVIAVLGTFFQEDVPMREGIAHAEWDSQGQVKVVTDLDAEGGGETATRWMQGLVEGLQAQLGGSGYSMVPNLLPAIGFQYDPDGFNLGNGAKGYMVLRWTDENGELQTRYYDGAGQRGDGSGETLTGDFMKHAAGAIAPTWVVDTALAHWQQGGDLSLPDARDGLPKETADGLQQSIEAVTLALPGEAAVRQSLIDVDGDGYLELTQWVAANQQLLAIDTNGDGLIGAGEMLNLDGGRALNSAQWLDANSDGVLDASDPAFAALRLWLDVNGDGVSTGETRTLAQAGISAIDFGSHPPAIVRADGSRETLTSQTLTAGVLGVAYQSVTGGMLQVSEQSDGSGAALLVAENQRTFDGQAQHMHGGDTDTDGAQGVIAGVDAGDSRLQGASAHTLNDALVRTSTSLDDGDARIQDGAAGIAQQGQSVGQRNAVPDSATVRSNGIVFVPVGTQSASAQLREVTDKMVRSSQSAVFGIGLGPAALTAVAVGAVADWPAVVQAADEVMPTDATGRVSTATQSWSAADAGVLTSVERSTSAAEAVPSSGSALMRSADGQLSTSTATPGPSSGVHDSGSVSDTGVSSGTEGMLAVASAPAAVRAPTAYASVASTELESSALRLDAGAPAGDASATSSSFMVAFPSVADEQAVGLEDTKLRFTEASLLANDSTQNSPPAGSPALTIISVQALQHGSVSLRVDPSTQEKEVVFIPEPGYHGQASFGYTVSDAYGLTRTAIVTLDLGAVNDAPQTANETASGAEDRTLLFTAASLLANDFDPDTLVDGDVLRITRVGAAEHGQVFLSDDGTVRFEPDENYNGPARFSYWVGDRDAATIAQGTGFETEASVALTILAVNDLPVVAGEQIDSDEDIALHIDPALLLANDSDVDVATNAQVLSITAVGDAQHGTVTLLSDGSIRFDPELDYFGVAGFSYTVDDGQGGQVIAQAVVNLAPVNDAPVVMGESIAFDEDTIQTISSASLLANDRDVDNPHPVLRIVSVDNATHGAVSMDANGAIRFVPEVDYFGSASFTYTVADGSGGFTVGTASLDMAAVNDAPRLTGDAVTLDEDTVATFTTAALLANDADVDNPHTALHITGVANATHGSVSMTGGAIVFTPDANFNGQASFTYTVADGSGGTSEASVRLDFTPVNDAPVANDDLLWGKRDVSYRLTQAALLANDLDVESPADLRVVSIGNVQHGQAVLQGDGSVTFTPDAGYAGRGSFSYVVQDPDGAQSTATAQIDFARVNVNPTGTDDSFIGYEDVPFSIAAAQLLVNDSDADNAVADLRVTAAANAVNGTVSMDAYGNVNFTPTANFYGTASFQYQLSDPEGGQTWATAYLNVQSVNDAPIIEDVWYGRPIYGYQWQATGIARTPWKLVAVQDEATALALVSNPSDTIHSNVGNSTKLNDLMDAGGNAIGVSYYLNGHIRPVAFDNLDGTQPPRLGPSPVDLPIRQNGGIVAYDPDGDSNAITFSVGVTPQHGVAWTNQYVPATVGSVDHTSVPTWVAQTGAWQYYSFRGDQYTGSDPFTITATDAQGATASASIAAQHRGTTASGGGACPIVIDLKGDGIELLRPEDSNVFADVNSDGWRERIGWAAPSDGVLVFDANADGRVDLDSEVSFVSYLPGARTDLEGLAAFDTDGDGWVTAKDAQWGALAVFQDRNGNGQQDEGEFASMTELGLAGIDLQRQGAPVMDQGNVVFGTTTVEWTDGHVSQAADVMFAGEGVALPSEVQALFPASQEEASIAAVERLAQLFNQAVNAASGASDAPALAFVPIGAATQADPDDAVAQLAAAAGNTPTADSLALTTATA